MQGNLLRVAGIIFAIEVLAGWLLIGGCGKLPKISFGPNEQIVMARVAARHIGERVAAKHPEYIEAARTICNGILYAQDEQARKKAFETGIALLLNKVVKDKQLRADISDLLSLIKVNNVPLEVPVQGFERGLTNGRKNND